MKNRKIIKKFKGPIPGLTTIDWVIIVGVTALTTGLLMIVLTVLSIGRAQSPEYFVNVGRSSFLHMLLGTHYPPFIKYFMGLSFLGGVLMSGGIVVRKLKGRDTRKA